MTAKSAEFWKRAVLEAMLANVAYGEASERDGRLPSTLKLVRKVDEFLDAQGTSAIHISRICGQLNVSRRTLHRAFQETLGIGPIAFLRHRRLCEVHTALRSGMAGDETIANLAMQHGFLNIGRFADYYRRLFAEYPFQTRLRAGADTWRGRTALEILLAHGDLHGRIAGTGLAPQMIEEKISKARHAAEEATE